FCVTLVSAPGSALHYLPSLPTRRSSDLRFLALSDPDERMAARVRTGLGDLRLKEKAYQQALPHFTAAIEALERRGGNSHYEALARESLADALTALGLPGEAERHLRRALEIHREGGGPRARILERRLEEEHGGNRS